MSSQEKRLQDTTNPPRIVIGTPKRLLEIVEANESLFQKTKRIVVDEVDKILLPLHKRASQKTILKRAEHPRSGRLLVEKIAQLSKVLYYTCTSALPIKGLAKHRRNVRRSILDM